jgi:hypothetical protein
MLPLATRRSVIQRAADRCEYCHLPQAAMPQFTFHVEHIFAQQHIQDDSQENLALACPDCNRHKGPNLTTLDAATRQLVQLFHPRLDSWPEHFEYRGPLLYGRSDVGRATIRLLEMNSDARITLRAALMELDEM